MEQENTNSLLKLFDPKFLRPLMYEVIPQLPKHLFEQLSAPPSTPLEGRYKPSFLERAAFSTDPFDATDGAATPQKLSPTELIRGSQTGGGEVGKKTPAELIMSTDDLKRQMPPLPDVSKDTVKIQEAPEQQKHDFSEQGGVASMIPQSPLFANIDQSSGDEAQRQQKNAMDYIAEINNRSMAENPQESSPVNQEALSHTPVSEEEHLKANAKPEQAADYVNAVGNFLHKDANPSGLWDRFRKSEFSEHLMDFFAGLASGKTPQESFSNAALVMRQGNNVRAQNRPIFEFLRSKGYSDKDAQALVQYPDLAMKVIGSTLSPQEGYRTLTAAEKAEQGLPENMTFQVSTSTGKIIPVQGGQRSTASGLGGNTDGMLSKPESGYMYVKDENALGGIRAVPIAGSGAEHKLIQEQKEEERKNQQTQMQILETADRSNRILSASKELLKIVEEYPHVVGFSGPIMSFLPNSRAKDFGHMLDSLKANIGIDALRKAKAFSPNGASGFGNLSNMELQTLQNSVAALYQDLSAEQMKKSLKTVIDTFNKSNAATRALLFGGAEATRELVRAAYGEDAYKGKHAQSNDSLEKQIDALPEGVLFIDSDGRIKEKKTNG
ncbi:hypothetical protein [Bartonella vinsonii]|uniref:Uncharacterized protein n=1 Tax=Bartonella vinsonii subsp. berkhoffii str. Tweed TaxID=1094502 RepID=N6VLC9_BARVB|nr:hypothetical protein [Bartonella vinsonii]ENN93986.1 hypothetical protein BVtw_14760 [Bartonella vinsonii subsp. berkhoffii str. Tweed]